MRFPQNDAIEFSRLGEQAELQIEQLEEEVAAFSAQMRQFKHADAVPFQARIDREIRSRAIDSDRRWIQSRLSRVLSLWKGMVGIIQDNRLRGISIGREKTWAAIYDRLVRASSEAGLYQESLPYPFSHHD